MACQYLPAFSSRCAALFAFLAIFGPMDAHAATPTVSLHEVLEAPANLTLSGSVRVRYETLGGQARPGISANDDLVNFRTRLFGEYRTGPMRFGTEIFDSRAYGGDFAGAVSANEVNAFELVQAYSAFDFSNRIGGNIGANVQAGRFILELGSRRLLGAEEYRNTISSYTGLRANFSPGGGVSATLIYALPHTNLPDDKRSVLNNTVKFDRASFDLVLWGGYVNKLRAIGETDFDFTYLHLAEGDTLLRPTRNRSLDTIGARLIREPKPGRWDYEAEGIYQFGTVRDGLAEDAARLNVSAWFLHADAGYTHPGSWEPRISVEADYASGDGSGRSYNRFDTLFGMRRADLAPAGIFATVGRTNLITPGIRIEAIPSARFDWFATYRLLWLASPTDSFSTSGVQDPTGQAGQFAGQQIDGRIRYWVVPGILQFEADAVFLLKGQFLKFAPNAPATGNPHYISFNLIAYF